MEIALTFLILIETCKTVSLNVRDYIVTTMKPLMEGNKNYDALISMISAV